MSATKQDQRIVRTRKKLGNALTELIVERGDEAVTIRDIVERADVGYATFFRHYADKNELLLDALDLYMDDLIRLVRREPTDEEGGHAGQLLFEFVAQHPSLSRVFLLSRSNPAVAEKLRAIGAQTLREDVVPMPGSLAPLGLAVHFIVSASMSLIQWWLENDQPLPVATMGENLQPTGPAAGHAHGPHPCRTSATQTRGNDTP